MYSSRRCIIRFAVIVILGLLLFAVACSTRDPSFSGMEDAHVPGMEDAQVSGMIDAQASGMVDAQAPPGTATLTVTHGGTATGTVSSNPGGINCSATCSGAFRVGTKVTLTVTPGTGSRFAGWSGGGCTGTDTCVVTVATATTVTANFTPILYSLTVMRVGAGTVTLSPDGIGCGPDCTDYVEGVPVTLTATPNMGSTFAGWSGGNCTGTDTCMVTMNQATTITATFKYRLSVSVGVGGGTGTIVSTSDSGISCSTVLTHCTEDYVPDTMVTLSAEAEPGSKFAEWSDGCNGTNPTCTVTMTAAKLVSARFDLATGGGGGGGGCIGANFCGIMATPPTSVMAVFMSTPSPGPRDRSVKSATVP